jgi:hypothetical protein
MDRYFEENKYAAGVDLNLVEHALLPTKNYYQKYSDQVRLWMNESSTTQPHIREAFQREAREALLEQGIDTRDMALTPNSAREHLAGRLA